MCAIVDANMASRFFALDPDLLPLWKWINDGEGRLAVGGQLTIELNRVAEAGAQLRSWLQAGLAFQEDAAKLEAEQEEITGQCSSNDPHVIALARVSRARILCSSDRKLHADFRNRALINNPRGSIYQSAQHADHVLRHQGRCPLKSRSGR